MKWTEKQIKSIVQDMAEENLLFSKALLKISDIDFTAEVPTMAVSLSDRPLLEINLNFCNQYLKSDNDVKAALLHEFLHILLLHTKKFPLSSPMMNFALDAIINATIFRYKGMDYAKLFARMYSKDNIEVLLRPLENNESAPSEWDAIHKIIYSGKYCAGDLFELLCYLNKSHADDEVGDIVLLGNHSEIKKIPRKIQRILDDSVSKVGGHIIWNNKEKKGKKQPLQSDEQLILNLKFRKWKKSTYSVLKQCLTPNNKNNAETTTGEITLPVLNAYDSRALARFYFGGIMPLSRNEYSKIIPAQLVTVYLDVSGSMDREIQAIVALLHHFKAWIRKPLWVFSEVVEEAKFSQGKLKYNTTRGTSITPVLDHFRKSKTEKCLIVTDGYTEDVDTRMLEGINKDNITALVSAAGNPEVFQKAGIRYKQLESL